jgi:hypothetical protein
MSYGLEIGGDAQSRTHLSGLLALFFGLQDVPSASASVSHLESR